jgi:AcrR family transcriptional regulator
VSPKVADPAVRVALIEHAARITAEEGRDALSLRKLAAAVGASTMAVYTHFGSMDDLRRAVRREGFARLGDHLESVEKTGDAVADLLVQGAAYFRNAIDNPNLYRAMFMDGPVDEADSGMGYYTFEHLIDVVKRCIESGRIDDTDPVLAANQFWAIQHGIVTLCVAGLFDENEATATAAAAARNLLLAMGDSPAAVGRSFSSALPRAAGLMKPAG